MLILIKISLKFVPKGQINNIQALVKIMAWRRPGDKPSSEPRMESLLTHICVTRPQWYIYIYIYSGTVTYIVQLMVSPRYYCGVHGQQNSLVLCSGSRRSSGGTAKHLIGPIVPTEGKYESLSSHAVSQAFLNKRARVGYQLCPVRMLPVAVFLEHTATTCSYTNPG